jgi:hypothetical protein
MLAVWKNSRAPLRRIVLTTERLALYVAAFLMMQAGLWTQVQLTSLFPAQEGRKWGFIDSDGYWRIHPKFDAVRPFFEGLAGIRKEGKWGFIDEQGREVARTEFSAVGNFSFGRAPVRINRKWGYIDKTGKIVIPLQFQTASEFHDGLARVEFWDRVCRWSNEDAPEEYFDRKFTTMAGPDVCSAINARVGYVSANGDFIISAIYLDGSDFSEGAAVVTDRKTITKGYVDTSGKILLPFDYISARPFSEGLASVVRTADAKQLNKTIFIDRTGQQAVPGRFAGATGFFSEGFAPVFLNTRSMRSYGYIDKTGALAIGRFFAFTLPFSEGLAVVGLNHGYDFAYIDKRGTTVFRVPEAAEALPVKNGIAMVILKDGSYRFFDRNGKEFAARSGQHH